MQTNSQTIAALDAATDDIRRALAIVTAAATGAAAMLRQREDCLDIADGLDYAVTNLQAAYSQLPEISDVLVVADRDRVQEEQAKVLPMQQQGGR